jgi:hypothetical protein
VIINSGLLPGTDFFLERQLFLLVPPCHGPDVGEQVAELAVIDLHAVVQIEGDLLVGVVP